MTVDVPSTATGSTQSGPEAELALPCPRSLSADLLLKILGIRQEQNRALRRKLHNALVRLGRDWWPSNGQDDPDYGNHLLNLLLRPGGYQRYTKIIATDHDLVGNSDRLGLTRAVSKHCLSGDVLADLADAPSSWPDMISDLVARTHITEASLLAWAMALTREDPTEEIRRQVEAYPGLAAEFVTLTAVPAEPSSERHPAEISAAVSALLPCFGAEQLPSIETVERLASLAAELLVALKLQEERKSEAYRAHAVAVAAESLAAEPNPAPALSTPESLGSLLADVCSASELDTLAKLARDASDAAARLANTREQMGRAMPTDHLEALVTDIQSTLHSRRALGARLAALLKEAPTPGPATAADLEETMVRSNVGDDVVADPQIDRTDPSIQPNMTKGLAGKNLASEPLGQVPAADLSSVDTDAVAQTHVPSVAPSDVADTQPHPEPISMVPHDKADVEAEPQALMIVAYGTGTHVALPELFGTWCQSRSTLNRVYWLLESAATSDDPPVSLPPAAAVRTFLLADAVLAGDDEAAAYVEREAPKALEAATNDLTLSTLALLVPAALVHQQFGYRVVRARLPNSLPPRFAELMDAVNTVVHARLELSGATLASLRGSHSQKERLKAFRVEAARWRERAQKWSTSYKPAVHIWQQWLSDRGPLGECFVRLGAESITAREAAVAAQHWCDFDFVQERIEEADRQLRGHLQKPIDSGSGAAHWLEKNAAEAADQFREAAELLSGHSGRRPNLEAQFSRLCAATTAAAAEAAMGATAGTPLVSLAATALSTLAGRLAGREIPGLLTAFEIAAPLLATPNVALTSALQPHGPLPSPAELVELFARQPDYATAALIRAGRGEAAAADAALALLEATATDAVGVQDVRDRSAAVLDEYQRELVRSQRALQRELDRNRALDVIGDDEVREAGEHLALADSDRNAEPAAAALHLAVARRVLTRSEQPFVAKLRDRRDRLTAAEPAMLALVDAAIAAGDLERANEHLQRIEQGLPLQAAIETQRLPLESFLEFQRRLPDNLLQGRISTDALIRSHLTPLAPADQPLDQPAVRRVVDAWRSAQGRRGFVLDEARDVLRFLGFSDSSITANPNAKQQFRLYVSALAHEACPLHQFGSTAGHRYEILAFDQLPAADTLVRRIEAANIAPETPVIALSAQRLSEAQRRALLRTLRPRQRPIVVLDEALLLFLATQLDPRLKTFFYCALPWSGLQPYIIRPGIPLPPELFVGRSAEQRQLESPSGSCLMFGGRQLGKTAILREIERRHAVLGENLITFWLDLNGLGIAPEGGRPLFHVWDEIGRHLNQRGIKEATLGVAQLRSGVERWLKEKPERRILVLLDEADTFIEADGRDDFPQLRQMKGLMDATEQRFKVIFTGLHNVQRASHQVNTPVAHLGTPICVGPLQGRGEAEEAWRLVTEPFAARGFAFDPPDLPMAILARANYYPSLIQLICHKLLDNLDQRDLVPPHRINEDELRETLDDPKLRKDLQDRFLRTLGLDPRYHLFALCLAQYAIDQPDDDRLISGFEPGWFADQALDVWPNGFPDGAPPALVRTLLEEMVGLGVLAEKDGRFLLRSPNLRLLLGNREAISQELVGFIGKPAPAPYAPGTFRRRFGPDETDPKRSPLSMDDEGLLFARDHGAVVVAGMELAGIAQVEDALKLALPAQGARIWPRRDLLNEAGLRAAIQEVASQGVTGVNLIVIGHETRWPASLPVTASRLLGQRSGRGRIVRVVFVGDADAAWRWRDTAHAASGDTGIPRIREVSLLPWSMETVRRFVEETGIRGCRDEAGRDLLWRATGGFGPVLGRLVAAEPNEPSDLADAAVRLLRVDTQEPLGDWPQQAHKALSKVRDFMKEDEPFSVDDLAIVAEIPREESLRILEWAEWIGAVLAVFPGRYRLNPLIARLLLQRQG